MSNQPETTAHPRLEAALLSARRLLDWRTAASKSPLPRLPEGAIVTHQRSLLPSRRRWALRRPATPFSFDIAPLTADAVLVGCRGLGAPAAAIAVEELAVAGVRHIVVVDVAGSIDPPVRCGAVVLIESAIAADGTSPHYGADGLVLPHEGVTAALRERLSSAGIPFSAGRVWSTDAVFRETPSLIAKYRAEGAVLVDMETAAVFAVSAALGIEAAAVLVAADELHETWRPPADLKPVRDQLQRLVRAAAASLRA